MNRLAQKLETVRAQRDIAAQQLHDLYADAASEQRTFTADENDNFARLRATIETLDSQIRTLTDQVASQHERAEPLGVDDVGLPRASGNTGTPPTLREALAPLARGLAGQSYMLGKTTVRALVQAPAAGSLGFVSANLGAVQASDFGAVPLAQILFQIPTDGGVVYWNRVGKKSGAAAPQAGEGEVKAHVVIESTPQQTTIPTYAAWEEVSTQALADHNGLGVIVENILRNGVFAAADADIWTAVAADATAYAPTAGDTAGDSLMRAAAKLAAEGAQSIVIAMNPADYVELFLRKADGSGAYLGLPAGVPLPTIRQSAAVPAGQFLANANDGSGAAVAIRQEVAVMVGLQNDNLTRNLRTVLAEGRMVGLVRAPARVLVGPLVSA